MKVPYEKECNICGQKIYGFSHKDVEWRFDMHNMKHRKEQRELAEKEDSINNNGGKNKK